MVWYRKSKLNKKEKKCLKHDKNILSKILLRTADDIYYRKKCSRVLHIVPYVPMDETNTLSAWFSLIAHHKHYNLQSYNKWSDEFENSVKTLQIELENGNMETSMDKVVSKSKFQQELLSKHKSEVFESKTVINDSDEESNDYELEFDAIYLTNSEKNPCDVILIGEKNYESTYVVSVNKFMEAFNFIKIRKNIKTNH